MNLGKKRPMSDVDVMARTIYGESRNQPYQGQVAVGYVILNRSKQRSISITNVCLQRLQFSCWNINDPNRKIIEFIGFDNKNFMIAFGIACLVITEQIFNPVDGANHYHTKENVLKLKTWPPSWAKNMFKVGEVGAHVFLKG